MNNLNHYISLIFSFILVAIDFSKLDTDAHIGIILIAIILATTAYYLVARFIIAVIDSFRRHFGSN